MLQARDIRSASSVVCIIDVCARTCTRDIVSSDDDDRDDEPVHGRGEGGMVEDIDDDGQDIASKPVPLIQVHCAHHDITPPVTITQQIKAQKLEISFIIMVSAIHA
ncbi:hypothetical protein CGMCC3_g13997 [Colletotrichum fructicola]|nr:uncharacterized protein CGMCC3_g13997 [Colletotrichum fructicola]KAE9569954.1 hypothetical protein CGMCC3_g13997 [Colletotrichum fructicola]